MPFELLYHPAVKGDLSGVNEKLKGRMKRAVESRLAVAPEHYGEPLRKTLKGYWKLRVGDYRIVYKILKKEILILAIIHRKKVYEAIRHRIG